MHRANRLLVQIADIDNLRLAYWKAMRHKQRKADVQAYMQNWEENLLHLREQLLQGTVSVGNYHYFKIFDPKERTICAACFEERVLHHAIMNICHPYFERNLIYDTYATRIGKGTYAALDRAFQYAHKYKWVAKLDCRKYFDSISHIVLKQKLRRLFKDEYLLRLLDKIIDSYQVSEDKGVPIGNLTSQYFANFFLSKADHAAKETLRVKGYVRYMDDILLFADDKTELISQVRAFEQCLQEDNIVLKPYTIRRVADGVNFLGYKLYPHKILLEKRSQRRFKYKLQKYNDLLLNGTWTEKDYWGHITPLLVFTEHAYAKQWRRNNVRIIEALTV